MANAVKWVEQDGYYELHFEAYYEDMIVAKLCLTKDNEWLYVSDLLKVEEDYIYCADNLQEAKEEIEQKIEEYFQDQINYYEELLEQFKEREQNG